MKNWLKLEYFYVYAAKLALVLAAIAIILLGYGVTVGLFIAPIDYQQKEAVRIMYVHVPCAILSLSIYTIIGLLSIIFLIWKVKLADIFAQVSAPFGAMVTALALISGALWGKPMWGTWWVWDARLTSELILFFLYCGYIGLRKAILEQRIAATACAVLAIVGLLDIPIIHFSVTWWNTLHQAASITKLAKPTIAVEMLYPLLSIILAMYFLYAALVLFNARTEIIWRERKTRWAKTIINKTR